MFEQSKRLLKQANQFIPGGCSTESKRAESLFASTNSPAFYSSCDGAELIDADGNHFIDFGMALGACILGYNHPVVVKAVESELKKGILSILPSRLEPELAELIVEIFPSMEMVRFLKTGAEGCSAAIRLARAYTGRQHVLASGYFGWHDWCSKGPGVPDSTKKLCTEFAFNDSDDFLGKLNSLPEQPAAVIMEPVLNNHPQKDFLQIIKKSCDESGIVLIWDEVKSGARMAPGGAQQYYGFSPDLTVLGKGIANGMPLAAVGGKKEIMKTWDRVWISSTYASESLSLAAAIATLKFISENPVSAHLERLGEKMLHGFKKIADEFPELCAVSGIAQMNTIGLRESLPGLQELEAGFFRQILGSGFIIKRHGYNFVSYSHTERQIAECLNVIRTAFERTKARA